MRKYMVMIFFRKDLHDSKTVETWDNITNYFEPTKDKPTYSILCSTGDYYSFPQDVIYCFKVSEIL